MAKVVACIIARTVSKRLPLKVLRDLNSGLSMLDFLITRINTVKSIDEVYLCTSEEPVDDILEDVAKKHKIKLYRGSADSVIERMLAVSEIENAEILLRITGDNPLASIEFVDLQIDLLKNNNLDYVRVVDVPIGATIEVMTSNALEKCYHIMDPSVSEYLMLFLFEPQNFKCGIIKPFKEDFSHYSITVDTPNDLIRTKGILELANVEPSKILLKDIIEIYNYNLDKFPAMVIQQGGSIKYPFEKVITFEEFSLDMKRRKDQSKLFTLHE